MSRILRIISLVVLLQACTGYRPHSGTYTGGYSDRYLGSNVYEVEFLGNGFTSEKRVLRGVMLRSAELALTLGYPYFGVLYGNSDAEYSTSHVDIGDGRIVDVPVTKHGAIVRVQLLCAPIPGERGVYSADIVISNTRKEFGLDWDSPDVVAAECSGRAPATPILVGRVSPPRAQPAPSPRVPAYGVSAGDCRTEHFILVVSPGGEFIKLSDTSLWQVSIVDRVHTSIWLPSQDVIVCEGVMYNRDQKEKAGVAFIAFTP